MKKMNKKGGFAANLAVLGLVIALIVAIVGYNYNKTGNDQRDTLSVSGTSEITVSPDEAEVFINIITDAKTAKEAQSENREATANVMTALKAAGVKAGDLETTNYNLYKRTKWNATKMDYEEAGYELTNTIKITTADISNVGSLVDIAVNSGANGVDHVSFTLTKEGERKAKADALLKATEAAKDKANNLASTLEVKLAKVISVQENNFYYTPYNYYYNQGQVNYKSESLGDSGGNTISPQKIDISCTISVVYQLG